MNDVLIAIILGIVQGLTEFLPVSSSGHLCLMQSFFGERWIGDVLFDIAVHLGTMLAVLVFFYQDLRQLIKGVLPGTYNREQAKIFLCLLITTVITGVIGLTFRDQFMKLFSMPRVTATMLLVTGMITFMTDRLGTAVRSHGQINLKDAVMIGIFQALAIIPGISRSGSTIFAGCLSGMERTWAASYSFIAAIPAILGAGFLEWIESPGGFTMVHLIGAASAFIVGLISLKFLVWTLRKHNFFIFSIYCWTVGTGYLLLDLL